MIIVSLSKITSKLKLKSDTSSCAPLRAVTNYEDSSI